jgi:DNA-binding NarL/FixJ family response regulator
MAIRVMLADDHRLLREGLSVLLGAAAGIEVVAAVSDGEEAVAAAARLNPDLVLLDISMPRLDGLSATRLIRAVQPKVRVIILSMYLNSEYVEQAFASGASGYVTKDSAADELEAAIRAVAAGGTYASLPNGGDATASPSGRPRQEELGRLTHRQCQVLRAIALGRTTKGIARDLQISTKTVETHRAQLMDRLEIYEVANLVRFAVRNGLVTTEQ